MKNGAGLPYPFIAESQVSWDLPRLTSLTIRADHRDRHRALPLR
jgi:hypothetical protein